MPYRPACPKLSASQPGDDRKSRDAKTAMAWRATTANRRPDLAMSRRAISRLAAADEEHCEALRLGHLQLLLLKMALLSPAAPVRPAIRTLRQREHMGADEF